TVRVGLGPAAFGQFVAAQVPSLATPTVTPAPPAIRSFAYVTNLDDDTLSVIDTTSQKIVATIPVGHLPMEIAVTSDGSLGYVSDADGVTLVDLSAQIGIGHISTGGEPSDIAVASNGIAYVTRYDGQLHAETLSAVD